MWIKERNIRLLVVNIILINFFYWIAFELSLSEGCHFERKLFYSLFALVCEEIFFVYSFIIDLLICFHYVYRKIRRKEWKLLWKRENLNGQMNNYYISILNLIFFLMNKKELIWICKHINGFFNLKFQIIFENHFLAKNGYCDFGTVLASTKSIIEGFFIVSEGVIRQRNLKLMHHLIVKIKCDSTTKKIGVIIKAYFIRENFI